MNRTEYFTALQSIHLKLWLLERYLERGDESAQRLYRQYIALLRELLEKGEEFYS